MDAKAKKMQETIEHVVYFLDNTIDEINAVKKYISRNFGNIEDDWREAPMFNLDDFNKVVEPIADELEHTLKNLQNAVVMLGIKPTQDSIDEILSAFKE